MVERTTDRDPRADDIATLIDLLREIARRKTFAHLERLVASMRRALAESDEMLRLIDRGDVAGARALSRRITQRRHDVTERAEAEGNDDAR